VPTARTALRLAVPAFAALLLVLSSAFAEPPVSGPAAPAAPAKPADPVAALEGGTPLPEGAWNAKFPPLAKQSILFISDAEVERMVGLVKFDNPGLDDLGNVKVDGKGGGSGSFKVAVKDMTTGIPSRDEHQNGAEWLEADKFPDITYTITKLERVKPTVYRATGTWKMHGVEKPLVTLANVRFVKEMYGVKAPNGIARLKAKFQVNLKDFGVKSPHVGSPAVANAWDVEIVALGILEPVK
jgi:polyisoprenoid-binding protein YceI